MTNANFSRVAHISLIVFSREWFTFDQNHCLVAFLDAHEFIILMGQSSTSLFFLALNLRFCSMATVTDSAEIFHQSITLE